MLSGGERVGVKNLTDDLRSRRACIDEMITQTFVGLTAIGAKSTAFLQRIAWSSRLILEKWGAISVMGPDSSGEDLIRGIKPEDDDMTFASRIVQTSFNRWHHRRASAQGEDASGKGESGFKRASLRVTPG